MGAGLGPPKLLILACSICLVQLYLPSTSVISDAVKLHATEGNKVGCASLPCFLVAKEARSSIGSEIQSY